MNRIKDVCTTAARGSVRITIIARDAAKPAADWNYSSGERTIFVDSVNAARWALLADLDLDVERIVIDRTGGAHAFLQTLTNLPEHFTGDVILIDEDGGGFLSAAGRGGDRVLYALESEDTRFYLEAHQLVTGRAALRMTA